MENGSYYSGTKFFHFWSFLRRGSQLGPTAYMNIDERNGANFRIDMRDSIFDNRESSAHTFYYKRYMPSAPGLKYEDARLVTCAPVFMAEGAKFKAGKRGAVTVTYPTTVAIWNKTNEFSRPTTDYTYIEWPLPLLAIVPGNSNYSYAGRIMDIKMGPLNSPSGLIAKESPTSSTFDRILINGLWLPFGGTSAMIF